MLLLLLLFELLLDSSLIEDGIDIDDEARWCDMRLKWLPALNVGLMAGDVATAAAAATAADADAAVAADVILALRFEDDFVSLLLLPFVVDDDDDLNGEDADKND